VLVKNTNLGGTYPVARMLQVAYLRLVVTRQSRATEDWVYSRLTTLSGRTNGS